jgi:hypothetical protein
MINLFQTMPSLSVHKDLLNQYTVLNRPSLQSHVTIPFEEKTFGRCPMSQIISKRVTFELKIEKNFRYAVSTQKFIL